MKLNKASPYDALTLRQKAEELLKNRTSVSNPLFTEIEILKLIHEFEVHQMELELQNEELLSQTLKAKDATELYEFAPTGYYTLSREGEILELNHSGAAILGKERSELKNSRFAFFASDESKTVFNHFLERIFKSNAKQSCEITLITDTIEPVYIYLTGIVAQTTNHCLITATDITEHKQSEQALNKSETRFKNIFERNNAIMLLIEPVSGLILDANKAAADFYGYSLQQLLSMNIDEINISQRELLKTERHKAIQEKKNHFIFKHRLASGEERTVEVYSSPIEFPDKPVLFSIIHDITERKHAEKKLSESEKRYRQLVETANEAILVAQGNKFKLANSMASELSGYTEEELLSIPFIEFIHLDDRALVASNYMKRLKGEMYEQRYSFRFIGKDNNLRWVEMTGVKIDWDGHPATLNFVIDITARKQIEDALIESEKHAKALIGAIPDLLFIMNRDGVFLDYKADVKDLFYQSETIIGKRNREIMPTEFADLIDKKLESALNKGTTQVFEYQLKIPARGVVDYEARMVPYGIDQVVAIVRDVTERKKTETEVYRKTEDLIKANAEKDKFFSIIAHDLRGPIGGFMRLTEKMAEGMAEMTLDELQKMAGVMKKSSSNLFSLLGNLLEWSRMQRGLTTFEPISFVLLPKLHEFLLLSLDSADKKEIVISIKVPADIVVFADENMLASIIRNIVANALKFTPHRGKISISAEAVAGSLIAISISDTGIGMNDNIRENLFNIDVNTNRKGTDGELSTGLGLMICKDFIEKHRGELIVESKVGKGSTFKFTIPANGSLLQ